MISTHKALALLAAVVLSLVPAHAQIGTSTITGRVTDATAAVVPGVQVTVVNTATNFNFTAQTNDQGLFRVQSLQPGTYRITFQASGFKTVIRDNIDLRTGDTLALDATLEVGGVAEQVEVTGRAPLLETETSATGTVTEGATLYKLPIYQRWVASTFQLTPGMTQSGYAWGGSLGGYHVAGQRASSIGYFEDGVNAQDQLSGNTYSNTLQNSVEEVKMLTTALPAEYGHSAGGIMSVVKKTGTNSFHGMASDFGRTRSMAQRRFFDRCKTSQSDQGCVPQNAYFMQPDGSGGGPVVIPGLYNGRNRTFWFVGYQKLIEKKSNQFYATTPTPDMLNGDFTFGGIGNPIYDPASTRKLPDGTWMRDPIPGNLIPKSRIDPVAQKILSYNPWNAPNVPGSFNASGPVNNLLYDEKSRTFYEWYNGRLDHQFSPNFKIFGSYSYSHASGRGRPSIMKFQPFDGDQGNETPWTAQNYSAGPTWVINPTTINDARVGYFRNRNDKRVPSYGQNWPQTLGIPNVPQDLMPAFGVYGLTVSGPNRSIGETISFRDDLTKIMGTHAFKMGYELLRFRLNAIASTYPSGSYNYSAMTAGLQSTGNAVPRTGNDFAGFLMGYVGQATYSSQLTSWLPRSAIHSFYFQDDWKFSPTLTLNLGVRYSNESPFNTKYGKMTNWDPNATDDVTGLKGAFVHPNSALSKRDNNNFQPRLGLAWHPLTKWVFRGGFAVNTVDVKFPLSLGQFEEYTAQANVQAAPGDPSPAFRISQGPPAIPYVIRPNGTSPYLGTNYGSRTADMWDPNLRNPYVLNWNTSIQYELTPTYLLELAYQGSAGIGLIERWQLNTFPVDYAVNDPALQSKVFAAPQNYRPYPQFGNVLMRSNFGHSTYHSGTVKLEKRYSTGLTFITFYTFSKAIDSQDDDNSGTGVAPIQNRGLEKARAGYDRNHRFSGHVTYELPIGKGRRFMDRGGILNVLFGGYEIAWIQSLETGNPLTFDFANSPYNYYPTFAGSRRPNVNGTPAIRSGWRDVGPDRFNTQNENPVIYMDPFSYPAAFTPGNAGRNIVTGLPLVWSTCSAKKNFKLTERFNLQLRWDYNNTLKTFNFDPPTTTVDYQNPKSFGKISSDQRTANWAGLPLMDLTLQLTW
ncbi:MAG TPA: TonB-dependent receptor [Bryobacteraceae bacterium]|nr:TonB-dependent receptor [Bryobacteraceae bacterium]